MQRKLFQRCTHFLYCSVLLLGGNVTTRRMSKPDIGSIFHINNQLNILVIGNYYVNYQNYQNSMLLTSSGTKRTLMHLFLFTNSAQRELVSPLMNPNQIKFSKVEKVVNKYIDNFQTAMFPRLLRFMWISGKDTWFSQLLLSIWNMYFFYSSFCRAALCWWILFQYSLLLCDMQITH